MAVTLMKTKAEQTLSGEFAAKAKSLPGDAGARAEAMRAQLVLFLQLAQPRRFQTPAPLLTQ